MSTEPETTEEAGPGTPDTRGTREGGTEGSAGGNADAGTEDIGAVEGDGAIEEAGAGASEGDGTSVSDGAPEGTGASEDAGASGGAEGAAGEGAGDAGALSEAEAELAAQRIERERIERRKAEKKGPIASGTKLSGKAADLLAAVRAVESGEKPVATVFTEPAPAPRRPAPEPMRRPQPAPAPVAPAAPAPETVDAVRRVLAEGSAPDSLAPQVAAVLGEGAGATLREDPWQLLRVGGVRPEQADGFARALLGPDCGPGDARRGRAVTVWLLEQAAVAGHTALELPTLTAALGRQGVPDPDAAVQDTLAEGEALVFQDALEEPGAPAPQDADEEQERPVRVLVGLERYAMAEESLADGLARLANSVPEEAGQAWEAVTAGLSGGAAELARAVAGHGLVLHTGGEAARAEPAALLAAARAAGLRAYAACHTPDGRSRLTAHLGAASGREGAATGRPVADPARQGEATAQPVTDPARQGEATGRPMADPARQGEATARPSGHPAQPGTAPVEPGATFAQPGAAPVRPGPGGHPGPSAVEPGAHGVVTVSGLLAGVEGPGRDADGALEVDLLIVLDAPQLDVEGAAMLVESLPDGARLVLSGDPGVLWSAGPGRVFADLLAARICPQAVSRVPDPGPLGELVSGIGVGELNQVAAPGKEIVIVPVRDAGEAVHRTVQLVADSVPRAIGVPADQTVVITPGHGGAAGTRALNSALKQRLNPGPGRFGGFDPGDRIAYSPAPGRTVPGVVVKADADGLHLSCAGAPVVVPRERVEGSVRHGWALTAHQAAGARWPAAVVVLPGDAAQALSRPWVYTAFGRAERHLSVVHGVEQALPRAVAEVPAKPRTTRLGTLLRTQAPAS
ncbi:helix-hairpin-helix domain-containing protein [Streptomyces sp. CSDS2]|uniref:helix-hairpin-helix domain-containing protein n=1 Tax=Streptomyces sp. CSDS2 TaxID=3055051 RepID=UPI0025B14E37|nr:helix-hairpin-helix domain-containing protein [Streptomyces sp. CSDS2]MDN3264481.1 helix-hairpin-helix domain-containing protein [Streptomyces sp. CSDS2]